MDSGPMTFRPRPAYQAFYLAPLAIIAFLLYELWRAPVGETWLMLGMSLVLVALTLPRVWARVTLDEDRLVLHMPWQQPQTIHLRQLISVENSGRRWNTLVLRYHPMDERGRLDIASQEFLSLVPLEGQAQLEERLAAVVG